MLLILAFYLKFCELYNKIIELQFSAQKLAETVTTCNGLYYFLLLKERKTF